MILQRIVASTKELTARRKAELPQAALAALAATRPAPRDFVAALRRPGLSIIAEIKRASPSKGLLRADLDPAQFAALYAASGADAISILTEPSHFLGSLADLAAARAAVPLPLLRKDFIVDPYQVYEARAHGADAFLLIVAALDPSALADLIALGRALGLAPLVEVHDEAEVALALAAGAAVVGVNNRNLADFSIDLATTPRLRRLIPPAIPVVGESGIHSPADVARLAAAGVDAVLVGEALVTSADPGARLRELLLGAGVGHRRDDA